MWQLQHTFSYKYTKSGPQAPKALAPPTGQSLAKFQSTFTPITFELFGQKFPCPVIQVPRFLRSMDSMMSISSYLDFWPSWIFVKYCFFTTALTNFVWISPNLAHNLFRWMCIKVFWCLKPFSCNKPTNLPMKSPIRKCLINELRHTVMKLAFQTMTWSYSTNFMTAPPRGQKLQWRRKCLNLIRSPGISKRNLWAKKIWLGALGFVRSCS